MPTFTLNCENGHAMKRIATQPYGADKKVFCDQCSKTIDLENSIFANLYHCSTCAYDLCQKCIQKLLFVDDQKEVAMASAAPQAPSKLPVTRRPISQLKPRIPMYPPGVK
jgi:hypothetical protein